MRAFFQLSLIAQYFLLLVLVLAPVGGVVGYWRIRRGKPQRPKRQRYRAMIVSQIVLLALTVVAANRENIPLLWPRWGNVNAWIFAFVYLTYIAWRLPRAWAKLSPERLERARRLLPDDPALLKLWVAIAAFAGISEECAYRGLAFQLLQKMGYSLAAAMLVCMITFAIAHMTQGWRGVLGTFLLALVFHAMVILGGALYPAILLHAGYNFIVGIVAIRFLSRAHPTQEQPMIEAKA
jgi:membrane protease YdiL (CAAX protease family)